GIMPGLWSLITRNQILTGFLVVALLVVVAYIAGAQGIRDNFGNPILNNLTCARPCPDSPWASGDSVYPPIVHSSGLNLVGPEESGRHSSLSSSLIAVRPGSTYHFSVSVGLYDKGPG